MYVDRCVYEQGVHVYAGPKCPHGRVVDEEGPVVPTGWTVQTGQTSNPPVERQPSGYSNQE